MAEGFILNYFPTPVLWKTVDIKISRGHPDGSESLRTSPQSSFLAENRQRDPWRRRGEKKGLSAGQHVHLLQHREGPVGSQGLSHRPGTVIPDRVALEAVEQGRSASAKAYMRVPSGGLNLYGNVTKAQGTDGGAAVCFMRLLPTTQDLGRVGSFQCCSGLRIPSGFLSICLLTENKVPKASG